MANEVDNEMTNELADESANELANQTNTNGNPVVSDEVDVSDENMVSDENIENDECDECNKTFETLKRLAGEIGFEHFGKLNTDALIFREEVRAMCEDDRCGSWNKSWTCPPACGSLEAISRRAKRFSEGILVQTTGSLEDPFDMEAMRDLEALHKQRFQTFVRQAEQVCSRTLPMSAGTCTLCRRCTYPSRPCRFPGRAHPSMEAYGLLISEVLERSGMRYNYGKNTMTFTSCILFQGQKPERP